LPKRTKGRKETGRAIEAKTQTGYERLGGAYPTAVKVDEFIDRIVVDYRLKASAAIKETYHNPLVKRK
jgi:hypothetical protein